MKLNMSVKKILKRTHFSKLLCKIYDLFANRKRLIGVGAEISMLKKMSPLPKSSSIAEKIVNNHTYDLDIVVPCYNTEKYLRECIGSIINQKTEYKFRVILIDDGATDHTNEICDEYIKLENVIVVHQKNKGFSGARNTGLQLLDSKYLTFVDSDDTLAEGAIENLLGKAYKENADIVEGGFNRITSDGRISNTYKLKTRQVERNELDGYPWGKVFKSDLFNGIRFPEGYWFEDTIMRYLIYFMAGSIYLIDAVVYNYRLNLDGITANTYGKSKTVDTVLIFEQLFIENRKFGFEWKQMDYDDFLRHCKLSFTRLSGNDKQTKEKCLMVFADIKKKYLADFKTEIEELKDTEASLESYKFKSWLFL